MSKTESVKIEQIIGSINGLKFGSVLVTIHEGEITQIDITEKKRFPVVKKNTIQSR